MPDTREPRQRLRDPEALRARDAMRADGPEGRAAARKLIDLTLGGQQDPTLQELFSHPAKRGPEISTTRTPSQLVQDLVSFLSWQHPPAGSGVATLGRLEPQNPKDDTLGAYGGLGGLVVREQFQGKPRTQQELKEVILHELSHAMGTDDVSGRPDVIGAYDISNAARALRPRDINLPNDTAVVDALLARQGIKKRK